ncbi:MAG: roadblock/LC7 domain-containing protein [Pseudomonadota bacterium]
MAGQNNVSRDIFEGAEKVEVLGKLPVFLWEYIHEGRRLIAVEDIGAPEFTECVATIDRMLSVLEKAADHLGNEELKKRVNSHMQMVGAMSGGRMAFPEFKEILGNDLANLEQFAGTKPAHSSQSVRDMIEREYDRVEKIKTGRSADVIMTAEMLDDIRDYLVKEVLIEGISSVLIVDNAGSLIADVGDRIEMDVVSLAAVAAANFAATERIARIIGEQDFVLLFYKGHSESFHFSRVSKDYIIVTIFNNSLSLGLLRLKIAEVVRVLEKKLPKKEG